MSFAGAAFIYAAVASSGGALAFLSGQKSSGRTSPEAAACYEQAAFLESLAKDLAELREEARKAETPEELVAEIERAREELEEATSRLRRGADLVV